MSGVLIDGIIIALVVVGILKVYNYFVKVRVSRKHVDSVSYDVKAFLGSIESYDEAFMNLTPDHRVELKRLLTTLRR